MHTYSRACIYTHTDRVLEDTSMAAPSASLKRLNFNMKDVESFRYRVADVSRAVTKAAVKEARYEPNTEQQ